MLMLPPAVIVTSRPATSSASLFTLMYRSAVTAMVSLAERLTPLPAFPISTEPPVAAMVMFLPGSDVSILTFVPEKEMLLSASISGSGDERSTTPPCACSFWTPEMVPLETTSPPSPSPASPPSSAAGSPGMSNVMVAPLGAEAMVRLWAPVPPKAARATSPARIEPAFSTDLPTR